MLVWISISLILVGMLLVLLEFFIPSAGILGVVAGCLLIGGVVVAFFQGLGFGAAMLLVVTISIPILFAGLVKVWPYTPLGRAILIGDRTAADVLPDDPYYSALDELVGKVGVAHTPMLPSGIVKIDGHQYDSVCDGFAVQQGDMVKVVGVKGNRIHVQPAGDDVDVESGGAEDPFSNPIDELGIDFEP